MEAAFCAEEEESSLFSQPSPVPEVRPTPLTPHTSQAQPFSPWGTDSSLLPGSYPASYSRAPTSFIQRPRLAVGLAGVSVSPRCPLTKSSPKKAPCSLPGSALQDCPPPGAGRFLWRVT